MIEAIAYLGEIGTGISKPKKMLCNDNVVRVVKFNHPAALNRSLFHEYLCYEIANLLGLPVLQMDLVQISQELANAYNNIDGMSPGIKTGTLFSAIDSNIADNGLFRVPFQELYGSCVNKHVIPGIFVFDMWVHNNDRGSNDGNILVVPDRLGVKRLFLNDHGFAFVKPMSDMERYKILTTFRGASLSWQDHLYPLGPIYEALKQHIDLMTIGVNPFIQYVSLIESISKDKIQEIVYRTPAEWQIPDYELEAIVSFLHERKYAMRKGIDDLVAKFFFPRWNGGVLQWPAQSASSE